MKAHGFRVSFTPLLEVLFTFPSRYLFAIGLSVVFSLAGWAPQIPAEFLVLRGTQVPARTAARVSPTGLSPPMAALSSAFGYARNVSSSPVLQPRGGVATATVWAPARSLATTCAIIDLFSLPPGTKMFQFPGFARRLPTACRRRRRRVPPFGHPRITGHLPLHAAFRSLSRPSSPPRATGIPRAPLSTFLLS